VICLGSVCPAAKKSRMFVLHHPSIEGPGFAERPCPRSGCVAFHQQAAGSRKHHIHAGCVLSPHTLRPSWLRPSWGMLPRKLTCIVYHPRQGKPRSRAGSVLVHLRHDVEDAVRVHDIDTRHAGHAPERVEGAGSATWCTLEQGCASFRCFRQSLLPSVAQVSPLTPRNDNYNTNVHPL
jgi:hypothetical protein